MRVGRSESRKIFLRLGVELVVVRWKVRSYITFRMADDLVESRFLAMRPAVGRLFDCLTVWPMRRRKKTESTNQKMAEHVALD